MLLGSAGISTSTFNITAASITGAAPSGAGYNDGTAGTTGSAAGSVSASGLGRGHIAEIYTTSVPDDRLIVKGFTSDPGINFIVSAKVNGTSRTGSAATYSYDSTNGAGKWVWSGNGWGMVTGNTYNNNTITHNT
jgi:hypothetical protein